VPALTVLVVAAAGSSRGAEASGRLVLVGRFDAPVFAAAPPGAANTMYVVEQAGRIVAWQNGKVRARPFLDIRNQVTSGGEQGLLSVAFDPLYARNHFFYVDYTDLAGDTRVVRYRSNGTSAIAGSAKQLLFVEDFAPNHNGGQVQFGPDGFLYWGNGDGGGQGDPEHNAGRYYFGDNCSGNVWSFQVDGGNATSTRLEPFQVPGLSSFAQDSSGELYLMSVTTGNLYRLQP